MFFGVLLVWRREWRRPILARSSVAAWRWLYLPLLPYHRSIGTVGGSDFFPPFLPIIAPFPAIFVIASCRHKYSSIFPPLLLVSHILDMSENNATEFRRRNSCNLSHPDIFVLNSPMERNKLLEMPADTR